MVLSWTHVKVWYGREEIVELSYFCFLCTQKKYSHSFITLRLNHWCHDYFNNVLTTSLGLNVVVALLLVQGQKALGFHQKYLNLCSEYERRSYRFGTTWGWVINDRIVIFGWTIHLIAYTVTSKYGQVCHFSKSLPTMDCRVVNHILLCTMEFLSPLS